MFLKIGINMFSILSKNLADMGFYINLDQSAERRDFIEKQIKKFDISGLNRFSALTDDMINYACTKSHRSIFKYCLQNDIDSIFIAEDDFEIYSRIKIHDICELDFKDTLYSLPSIDKYDVIMFGCNPKKPLIPIGHNLAINSNSTGAWAYVIKKRAMRYILDHYNYEQDYFAIDNILPQLNYKGFQTVVTIPQIIHHRDGILSTLQPHIGTTRYSNWITGNWSKYLYEKMPSNIKDYESLTSCLTNNYEIEKKISILITGHSVEGWLTYLRYLLFSIPKLLLNCRFIICYDNFTNDDKFELGKYFRDYDEIIEHPHIEYITGGLISSLKKGLETIQTDYFLWLEHDWVFLDDSIDWNSLVKVFDKYSFVNSVWFNKDDNNMRGFDICDDLDGSTSPYEIDNRISELPMITTCRWSNNPVLMRTSKMKEWFEKYVTNEYVDKINQGSHNIEENLIPSYRNEILINGWKNIKDNWGTYLYGDLGTGPYVAHTDASRRYQHHSKSQPEINGEKYMKNNPLPPLN